MKESQTTITLAVPAITKNRTSQSKITIAIKCSVLSSCGTIHQQVNSEELSYRVFKGAKFPKFKSTFSYKTVRNLR